MIYITVLDYSIDTTTVYMSEEEIENLIRENHRWEDTYYMVSNELNFSIKSI